MEIDQLQLTNLLQEAIGKESQVVFAKKCGISKEHLNRMLSGKTRSKPSKTTLRKIAENSSVSYEQLLTACGYSDEMMFKPVSQLAQENAEAMLEGFRKMTECIRLYPSVRTFMEELFLVYGKHRMDLTFCRPEEYDGSEHAHAEYFQRGRADFYAEGRLCSTWFVIYFCQTKGGQVVVVDAAMDGKTLMENQLIRQQAIDELYADGTDVNALPYYFEIRSDGRAEERLLKALFGKSENQNETVVVSNIGLGFELEEVPPHFAKFLDNHTKTAMIKGVLSDDPAWAVSRIFNVVSLGTDPERELSDCLCRYTYNKGYAAVIANIMSEETGIRFGMWDGLDDGPVTVMCDDEDVENDEVLPIIRAYAKELGVKRYGECIAYTKYEKDSVLQFEVDDEEEV